MNNIYLCCQCLALSLLLQHVKATDTDQCTIGEECVTDLTQEDCPAGEYLTPNLVVHGCCPGCEPRAGLNEICVTMSCAPGLTCLGVLCVEDINASETCVTTPGNIYPSCLPDGKYAPVQCKGDIFNGRCFCSDEFGNRIFGQMWRDQASEMTCACSRRRAELEASGRTDVTLHCTPAGSYEPLQCDSGLCWCVESTTGQPVSSVVSDVDMKHLPCYRPALVGAQYLRQCESSVHALAAIHKEQAEHGTHFITNADTFCSYDGSYGPYQITNGIAYCTGRDGEILGSWQVVSSEMAGMNCNCALDTAVYFPERGMSINAVCLANGNYRAYQTVGQQYYCVDSDGYQTTGLMDELPANMCTT